MTPVQSRLVVVAHNGEVVERMGGVQPDTKEDLRRLRGFIKNGDGLNRIPSESKDIIRGAAEDLKWRSLPFDQFWGMVEQKKISVVST